MNFVGLVSGGKDSIYSICKLIDQGHRLVALVHMASTEEYSDSYMYQTVGSEVAILLGQCLGVPFFAFKTACKTVNKKLGYEESAGDEVEDLFKALQSVKDKIDYAGVSSGAILSTYQKNRVENVCKRLKLVSLAPLWNCNQRDLLSEMISYGITARIVKVASSALEKACLNMSLEEIKKYMDLKNYKYEMNYCGEGGEYETLVTDCKHFVKNIVFESSEVLSHPDENGKSGGVYYLRFINSSAVPKLESTL